MSQVTATYAKNNLGAVWEMAQHEPVEVKSNGIPVAFIVSPNDYYQLTKERLGRPRRIRLLSDKFAGFDTDALLGVDVTDTFREALP